MPFQKGHHLSPGGKIGNKGGRPTKEAIAERESFRQVLERLREEQAIPLAVAYIDMATGKMAETATMRHMVDKVAPNAKQEIGVTANVDVGLNRESLIALMATPEGRAAAIAITKALAGVKP